MPAKPTELTEHAKIHTQKLEISRLNKLLKESVEHGVDLERKLTTYATLRAADMKPIKIRPGKRGAKKATTIVQLASDWHTPQIIKPGQVNGLNEHNAEIGVERGEKFFKDFVNCTKHEQSRYQIGDIVLWLGGDFLSNCHIHGEDSMLVTDHSLAEEVEIVQPLLVGGIQYIVDRLDCKVHVVCSVGNHGRSTAKKLTSNQTAFSWEQVMYKQVRERFIGNDQLSWDISDTNHKVADVAGFKILFTHGDEGVKGGGGIGGISVPFRRVVTSSWMPTYGVDFTCIGHFHQFVQIAEGMINGCLVGWDTFAKSMAFPFSRPQQMFFLVDHESRRVGGVRPIWA